MKIAKRKYFFVSIVILLFIFVLAEYVNTDKQKDWQTKDSKVASANNQTEKKFDGLFLDYSPERLLYALDGKVVLFFNALWCPTCSQFVEEIKMLKVPDNVAILSIDYDKYQNLREKYKVTYQHTFIEVDSDGKELFRWSGGGILRLKKELGIE